MSVEEYRWHFDYARLAWDLGFTFKIQSKPSLVKNVGHIDIDQVIRQRDVTTVDRYLSTLTEFTLDNDQTSVLDPTFVKIFRLGQLAIQYLLFCKNYLDNTVVILKEKLTKCSEEIESLTTITETLNQDLTKSRKEVKDLKSKLNCQIACTKSVPVFQCEHCPKAFSTEDYLSAHIKRHHINNGTSLQVETDKLQLEIKELKERLNNTEKFIHSEDTSMKKDSNANLNNTESAVLIDLQQKFELLKKHVENELSILQTQKFDQEKYEKWFEAFLKKFEQLSVREGASVSSINNNVTEKPSNVNNNERSISPLQHKNAGTSTDDFKTTGKRSDQVIQTDLEFVEPSRCASCNKQFKDKGDLDVKQQIQQEVHNEQEKQLGKFEEILQEKVTGSIEKLETQMQTIWNRSTGSIEKLETEMRTIRDKISEVESRRALDTPDGLRQSPDAPKPREPVKKPKAKPRKKLVIVREPLISPRSQGSNKSEPVKPKIVKTTRISMPAPPIVVLKKTSPSMRYDSETESEESSSESSESEEESIDSKKGRKVMMKPSGTSTLGQRSLTSLKEAAFTPEVLAGLQKEVENILNSRLEELGVASEWSTLPLRSYQRAVTIVNHQASLVQKNIKNYLQIRKKIIKDVDQQILEKKAPPKFQKFKSALTKARKIIHNEQDTKPAEKEKVPQTNGPLFKTATHRGKERAHVDSSLLKVYSSDTESDLSAATTRRKAWKQSPNPQAQKAYDDVIQELHTTVHVKPEAVGDFRSPIQEILKEDDEERRETQTKGVLKNFPSMGSLQKKKVLFDLDSSISDNKEKVEVKHEGGSTTSVASSELEGRKVNDRKESELADVSDWDISEVLD